MRTSSTTVNKKYILITFFAVLGSWVLHEFAHWITGNLLDYEMGMTLNKTFPVSQKFDTDAHYQLVSAAGPVITLVEAVVVFLIIQKRNVISLYPFLFTCFYMRWFAAIISFRNPNDEARISQSIGLGTFTIPVVIAAILLFLVYRVSVKYKLTLRFNAINLLLIILFSSIIILTDQFFHIRIL